MIEREDILPFTAPVNEINTLLLAHPQVTLTEAVLSRLAEAGAMVVTIDGRYLPVSMTLPLQSNSLQTERLAAQIDLSIPARKRLWQQIVRAKIRAQAVLLKELHGSDGGLMATAERVRSGDPANLEAQVARRYWGLVINDSSFHRGSNPNESGPDQNRHLDYGYTVLRAAVARAVCSAGLHPSLGLRHHNRYDAFCLAADLMEPFRPLIDRRVALWLADHAANGPFNSGAKRWLIEGITMRYWFEQEEGTLSDILFRITNSFASVLSGARDRLDSPEALTPCQYESTCRPTGVCG